MSAFNARGGPSVSEFLRDLHENPTVESSQDMYILNDQDMSMFTNTEFFDVETGQHTDFQPQPRKPDSETRASSGDHAGSTGSVIDDFNNLEFMTGEFGFQDFGQTYASPSISNFPDSLGHLQPIQPGPQSVYPVPPASLPQQNGHYRPGAGIGDKRKADALIGSPDVAVDDKARLAAEEDKRRRNTAASARFRVKKKEREKALEKSAKEMTEKVTALEGRIQQLETENKWLKSIVLEKNGGNEDFLAKVLEEFSNRQSSDAKRDDEVSALKAPTSPEERDAGDSSG